MRHIAIVLLLFPYLETATRKSCCDVGIEIITEVCTQSTTSTPTTTTEAIKYPWGPFYEFVLFSSRVVLNATTHRKDQDQRPRRINSCLVSIGKALRGLGPKFLMRRVIKILATGMKKLSQQDDDIVDSLVRAFYNLLIEMTYKKRDFFIAMNKLYDPSHGLKFEDYVYDLKQYLRGYTDRIGKDTREVWEDVVFHEFFKQDTHKQFSIQSLFEAAYEEYLTTDKQLAIPKGSKDEDESEELQSSD